MESHGETLIDYEGFDPKLQRSLEPDAHVLAEADDPVEVYRQLEALTDVYSGRSNNGDELSMAASYTEDRSTWVSWHPADHLNRSGCVSP